MLDDEPTKTSLHVLVVDDNETERKVALDIISNSGHIADEAINGVDAIEAAYRTPYDLIFMDLYMPEMDGFDATSTIRTLPDSRGTLPIIALTSTNNPEDVKKCFRVGMSNFILKPLTKNNFLAAISFYTRSKERLEAPFNPVCII